jgi:GTPase SAR1 family protein
LVFSSEIEIPGMMPSKEKADVGISFGTIPEDNTQLIKKGVLYEIRIHSLKLQIPGMASIYCHDNDGVIVEISDKSRIGEIPVFLMGSVAGYYLHKRNFLPVHGSALTNGERTIILCGASGVGKSTLAAWLNQNGWLLMSDDISSVQFVHGQPYVFPGTRNLKLWRDAMEKLGIHTNQRKVRNALEKYYVATEKTCNEARIVNDVFFLSTHNTGQIEFEEIKGLRKFEMLRKNTYRFQYIRGTSLEAGCFDLLGKLASKVQSFRITKPNYDFRLNELTKRIDHAAPVR